MICNHCKYPMTEVVYTKHIKEGSVTNRRRQCLRCGKRFTTYENVSDKKNGIYHVPKV